MAPKVPAELSEALRNGDVVLYAGSGLSINCGFPSWPEVVTDLLKVATQINAIDPEFASSLRESIKIGSVDPAADSIVAALPAGELSRFLQQTFVRPVRLSDVHEKLRAIPFKAVLTTNLDQLLEQTFEMNRGPVYTPRDTELLLGALSARQFFILKLYGDVRRGDVLFAPAQYEEVIHGNNAFAGVMETLFFSSTILFLGTSLEGIEAYLRGINLPGTYRRTHWALVGVKGTAWRAKADLLRRRYGIEVMPINEGANIGNTVGEFVRALGSTLPRGRGHVPEVKPATVHAPSRLRRVLLENIGPFRTLDLELDESWNVFLGDNGVGKSTILRAIAAAYIGRHASNYGARLISEHEPHAVITIETDRASYRCEFLRGSGGETVMRSLPVIPIENEGMLVMGFPPLRTVTWNRPRGPQTSNGAQRPMPHDVLPLIAGGLDPRTDELKQWILNAHYRGRSPLLQKFFDTIGELTEGMTLRFEGVDPQSFEIKIVTDDGPMPLEALSQGTISLLGWVAILMQRLDETSRAGGSSDSAIVLIDELDAHLHPAWQQVMVERLSKLFPSIQFIVTTHSPLIVAGMPPSQVRRFARNVEGIVERVDIEQEMMLGRTDQILTSDLFNLDSTLDVETRAAETEYRELLGKRERHAAEEQRMLQLEEKLRFRIPPTGETPLERQGSELLRLLLQRHALGAHAAAQAEIVAAGEKLLATLAKRQRNATKKDAAR